MKLGFPFLVSPAHARRRRVLGFTLAEVAVALAVFILVIAGILTAHFMGMKLFQLNRTKLTSTEWSRKTFGRIGDEVRACNSAKVGNVTNGLFTTLLDGQLQQGNGLLVYPTTNASNYVVYYVNTSDHTFRRATDKAGSAVILASSITNNLVFTAQNFSGTVVSNNLNNSVFHLTLQFYSPKLLQQDAYDYKLETSVTRRAMQ
jgi:hypothetical protein